MTRLTLLIGLLLAGQAGAASMNSDHFHVRGASVNAGGAIAMAPTDLSPDDPDYLDAGGTAGPGAGAGPSWGTTLDTGVGFWHAASATSAAGRIEVPEPAVLPGLLLGPLALAAVGRRRSSRQAAAAR